MVARTGSSLGVLAAAALVASLLVLGLPGLLSGEALAAGTVLHVKPGAAGDCTSWSNACELQTALNKAQSGDQVWAAGGTYYPTSGMDRTATFQLESGVALYGGFSGNETGLEGRNWRSNVTSLSGDIGAQGDASDNSYHVVTGSGTNGTAILDGFTVTGGNADGPQDQDGGGMYNSGGSPTLRNSAFTKNSAANRGGSMANLINSHPEISGVTFQDSSSRSGGGMLNLSSNPSLTDVTFFRNKVTTSQGDATSGIFAAGGGLHNMSSSPRLVNVLFFANTSSGYGGGAYNSGKHPFRGDFTFANAVFAMNTASLGGGGMYNGDASPTVVNNTFWDNRANDASSGNGGGIGNNESSPTISNTILWGNTANASGKEIHNEGGSDPRISYSLIKDSGGSGSGWSSALGTDGGNNIASDPKFENLSGNLRLQSGSPAIDTGNNASIPQYVTKDFDDRARIANGRVDMGAYESRSPNPEVDLPESVDYGDQTAGSNTTKRASLSNSGGQSLIFYSARITGDNADQFSIDTTNPNRCSQNQSLGPDYGCGVYVTFAPASSGQKRAQLEIQTNAASSPDVVELTGNGLNRPPLAGTDTARTDENTPVSINVLSNDSDPDGDTLTVASVSTAGHGSAGISADRKSVTYTPNNGYTGADSFTYTASDGNGGTATARVGVTVEDKTGPTASASVSPRPNGEGWNDSDATVTIEATDSAGGSGVEEVTYSATGAQALDLQTVKGATTQTTITTEGETTLTYSAKDKAGNASSPRTVTVKLDKTDPETSISGPDGPTGDDTPAFAFAGTDNLTLAGDLLYSYKLDDGSWSDYSEETGVTLGDSGGLSEGDYTLHLRTKDAAGNEGFAQRSFSVDTTPPAVDDQSVQLVEDGQATIILAGSDSRSATVSFKILSLPAHGKLYEGADANGREISNVDVPFVLQGDEITYVPDADYNGDDTFSFEASDGVVESEEKTVAIEVTPANDPPTAKGDSYETGEDKKLEVPAARGVLSNDSDPDGDEPLSVGLIDGPKKGRLTLNGDGSFAYQPAPNASGADSFTYTVDDGKGGTATATVEITVEPADDPPGSGAPGCTIEGTGRSERLRGTGGDDVICGLGGNDTINGGGGDDIIYAGSGNDTVIGGGGNDELYGRKGEDLLVASDGERANDRVHGGRGEDRCKTDRGDRKVGCS